jgi:hypothetical protein
MGLVEDLADILARDTLDAMDELDNDRIYIDVGKVLGTSSPTMQEAFLTSVRIRLAERRGRSYLEQLLTEARTAPPGPPKGGSS